MSDDGNNGGITYFEKQQNIYPQRVWGRYRKLKWLAMVVLLGIYYGVPWLRWDRGPHVPDQAVLIDMPSRRAYFFFIEIWPQEVYYLTAILIFAALMLFFVTALLGRVWCGYACPQTVWTDLFIWVERIVQGDRNARMKLDKSPLSFEKIWKKGLTHSLWILIGVCTGGAWVFYFNDAPTLWEHIIHFDVPWSVSSWIVALTASTYVMAGYAREQVCTFMCPYARFQSAMFDEDTLIIGYDEKRGEPRGKHKKGDSWDGRGHCIDCMQCVNVCPVGIDIRDGLQMECIACGLCVDACNNIMDKIELPRGLIRYDTASHIEKGTQLKLAHFFRPRTFWYTALLTVLGAFVIFGLTHRSVVELHVAHDRNPLYVMMSDGDIRNGYTLKILNKTHQDRVYSLSVEGIETTKLMLQNAPDAAIETLPVFADSVGHYRLFLFAKKQKAFRSNITFKITEQQDGIVTEQETIFISGEGR
jgi:cytochrome c oxidase accessory protein FixG